MPAFDLHAAIAAAKPRATISFTAAKLAKKLVITKPITLAGGTIKGTAAGAIVEIRADVTLKGVTVIRSGGIGSVVIVAAGHLVATKLVAKGGKATKSDKLGAGVSVGKSASAKLVDCRFERNHDGLVVEDTATVDAKGIVASGNRNTGIAFIERSKGTIAGCSTSGGLVGLFFGDHTTAIARDCIVEHATMSGVMFRQRARPRLDRVRSSGNREHGFVAHEQSAPQVARCVAETNRCQGILWRERASGTIDRTRSTNNKLNGLAVYGKAAPVVRGCELSNNGAQGVLVGESGAPRIEQCLAEANRFSGLNAWESAKPSFVGNTCRGNKDCGILAMGTAVVLAESNTCTKNVCDGIQVLGSARATLTSNRCEDNRNSGFRISDKARVVMTYNTARENAEDGFELDARTPELVLRNNRASENSGRDLYVHETVDEDTVVYEGNEFVDLDSNRYTVELGKYDVPELVTKFGEWLRYRRVYGVGEFELCVGRIYKPKRYEDDAHRRAICVLDLLEGGEIAITAAGEVVHLDEGDATPLADNFHAFLEKLARARTGVSELDRLSKKMSTASARRSLRRWLATQQA